MNILDCMKEKENNLHVIVAGKTLVKPIVIGSKK